MGVCARERMDGQHEYGIPPFPLPPPSPPPHTNTVYRDIKLWTMIRRHVLIWVYTVFETHLSEYFCIRKPHFVFFFCLFFFFFFSIIRPRQAKRCLRTCTKMHEFIFIPHMRKVSSGYWLYSSTFCIVILFC